MRGNSVLLVTKGRLFRQVLSYSVVRTCLNSAFMFYEREGEEYVGQCKNR